MDKEEALASLSYKSPGPDPVRAPVSRPGRRRRFFLGLTGALFLLGFLALIFFRWIPPTGRPLPPSVRVLRPSSPPAPGAVLLSAAGYVVARRETTVSSRITGMIRAVYVQEGMAVRRHQILARLESHTARAQVALSRRQLAADRALILSAEAQLRLDRKNLARVRAIFDEGLESHSALDSAEAAVAIDQATLREDQANAEAAMASLRLSRLILRHTVIRAPFSGIVTAKYAHRGEMISPAAVGGFTQTGICRLVDMHSLEMDVDVNESFINRVHAGEPAQVGLSAYPNWKIPARVISIVPTANKDKGTVKVRVSFDRLDPRILPEMSGEVYFLSRPARGRDAKTAAVTLPLEAVSGIPSRPTVFRVVGGRVFRTAIRVLGHPGPGQLSVTGFPPGAPLVIQSPVSLHNGERVRVRHSPQTL